MLDKNKIRIFTSMQDYLFFRLVIIGIVNSLHKHFPSATVDYHIGTLSLLELVRLIPSLQFPNKPENQHQFCISTS